MIWWIRNFELNFFESKCPDKTGNSEFLAWTSWNRSSGALFDSIKILIKLKHRLSRIWSHWIIELRTGMVMLARMRMEWDYRSKLRILNYSFGTKWQNTLLHIWITFRVIRRKKKFILSIIHLDRYRYSKIEGGTFLLYKIKNKMRIKKFLLQL